MKKVILVAALTFLASQFWSGYPVATAGVSENGDVNGDLGLDLSDAIYLLTHLFQGGDAPEPCPGAAGAGGGVAGIPLPATGQTKCYHQDGTEDPECDDPEVTNDCPGQDALYQAGCPNDANRFILDHGPNGVLDDLDMPVDDTVTDLCTGLMWQAYTADINKDGMFEAHGTNPSPDRVFWCDALTYCDDLTFAAFSDWRLPNIQEGQSLVEHDLVTEQQAGGAINPKFHVVPVSAFPGQPGAGNGTRMRPYWTSTHVTRKDWATEAAPVDGGSGYEVGDLLTVEGGVLSSDGTGIAATFKVNAVDPGGVVTAVGFFQPGAYVETPPNPVTTTSERPPGGPGGSLATLNVVFNDYGTRVAYFVNYEWGSLHVWEEDDPADPTPENRDVRNGAYVRAVRSVTGNGGAGAAVRGNGGAIRGNGGVTVSGNGDVNADNGLDLSDAIYLLTHLFQGGPEPAPCPDVTPQTETICDDNVDDDLDGNTDCFDVDCFLTPNCPGLTGFLPDTSQTACQDGNGEVIDCAAVSGCTALQDSLIDNGCDAATRFVDNGDRTVSDTCTGLMWLKSLPFSAVGIGSGWCAQVAHCKDMVLTAGNGTKLEQDLDAGDPDDDIVFDDWRLPNIRELQSIADYSRARPALDTLLWYDNPNCCGTTGLWSSTTLDADPASAYIVSFQHGVVAWRGKTGNPGVPGNKTPLAVRTP